MGAPEGTDAVGWRVQVLWEDENAWFEGVVTEYEDEKGYYVCYDDGDEKWQDTAGSMKFMSNTLGQSLEARVSSVVTPPATSRQESQKTGLDAVGWRVQVFWTDEDAWFDGVITKYDASKGYFVCYDDGETKWQDSNDSTAMVFVSSCAPVPEATSQHQSAPTANEPPSPTKTDYGDDGFDHHDDDDDGGGDASLPVHSEDTHAAPAIAKATSQHARNEPTPRQVDDTKQLPNEDISNEADTNEEPPPMDSSPDDYVSRPQPSNAAPSKSIATKPAKHPRHNPGMFFHDKETLLEMKARLAAKKKALDDEMRQLRLKVTSAENAEAAQKQEVADLTAKLTVVQLQTTRRVAPPKPQSKEEQTLDLTVKTRQVKKDNLHLRSTIQETTKRVDALKSKLSAARAEWNALPAQCRSTVTDVEAQIALLQARKETLSAELRQCRESSTPSVQLSDEAVALKKQLAESDTRLWQLKSDLHHWKGLCEQERSKLDAMHARLAALKAEMSPLRSSKVLLRSAFDRCDKDKSGELTVDETVQMLLLLAPPEDDVTEADMRAYFAQSDSNHDHRIDFDEFCSAVERLLTTS